MPTETSTARFGRAAPRIAPTTRRRPLRGPSRPWQALSWPVSLTLFLVPLALALVTFLAPRVMATPEVRLSVTDRYSGQALAGAQITTDDGSFATGPDGLAQIQLTRPSLSLLISHPGYEALAMTLVEGGPATWGVALRPMTLSGTITDETSKAGIEGATVSLIAPDGVEQQTATGADGHFAFDGVPEGATLRVSSPDYGVSESSVGQTTQFSLAMRPSFVAGQVVDGSGAPVAGARIAAVNGSAETLTAEDGTFDLTGGSDVQEVRVSAAGFASQTLPVDASRHVAAQLEPEAIKAIYANLGVLGDPERWNKLLEIADTTEINAIVIDVKQDTIYYDSQVPFFRDIDGMVTPVIDLPTILAQMKEHGIYSIARMVVFKDPVVAAGRPDLAVKDETTGGLWLDMNDTPWVNAFNEELWEANADLGAELAHLGFDEVQYDYIRFPSDGDLRTADFGNDYSEEERRAAITGAVKLGSERIRAAGAAFAIDLFPIVALMGDDQGIGQTLQDLTPYADYVCLMIYPSHYTEGNIPVDGHPNDFPAETVTYTLQRSQEWVPDTMKKMRPWLQDFTYPLEGFSPYGPKEVREQIDAAEAMGVSGWLLWNAAGEFEVPALNPE